MHKSTLNSSLMAITRTRETSREMLLSKNRRRKRVRAAQALMRRRTVTISLTVRWLRTMTASYRVIRRVRRRRMLGASLQLSLGRVGA